MFSILSRIVFSGVSVLGSDFIGIEIAIGIEIELLNSVSGNLE